MLCYLAGFFVEVALSPGCQVVAVGGGVEHQLKVGSGCHESLKNKCQHDTLCVDTLYV